MARNLSRRVMQLEPQPYKIVTTKSVLLIRVLLLNPAKQEKQIFVTRLVYVKVTSYLYDEVNTQ